jgi:hypothetical protein
MKLLARKKRTEHTKAHLWNGKDTECKMWLSGGIVKDKYEIVDNVPLGGICKMCQNNVRKRSQKND